MPSHKPNAIIFGAGHGIGLSIAKKLLASHNVFATYRVKSKAHELLAIEGLNSAQLDPLNENDLSSYSNQFKDIKVDLIINSIGALEVGSSPEKSFRSIDLETMKEMFCINAFITPLIAKHFYKTFSKESQSVLATLSAMVGSIEDNKIGGWYSYRASKTALNMFNKNISNELSLLRIPCKVLSIHPGTTETELSEKYLKGVKHTVWSPDDTASHILDVIENHKKYDSGAFVNWDGAVLPW